MDMFWLLDQNFPFAENKRGGQILFVTRCLAVSLMNNRLKRIFKVNFVYTFYILITEDQNHIKML